MYLDVCKHVCMLLYIYTHIYKITFSDEHHDINSTWGRIEKNHFSGASHCGSAETNLTSTHEDAGPIPGLAQ